MDIKEPTLDPSILPETNEETTLPTPERIEELTASLQEGAPYGSTVVFLDSINSVDELEQIRTYIEINNIDIKKDLLDWYRENLERWIDPESKLGYESFRKDFPLTANKLNTPQKIRVFLRFVDFCRDPVNSYVHPYKVARITERILHEHEIEGKEYVEFTDSSFPFEPQIPEKLAYFTQLQAWTAQKLLFPGRTSSGSAGNLFIDWRKQKGEK